MIPRELERRVHALEGKAGFRHKPAIDVQQAKALDEWFAAVTGKRIAQMSNSELERLENLFRAHANSGEATVDDALVRGCMDVNQHVIDLEHRRRQLDLPPWR